MGGGRGAAGDRRVPESTDFQHRLDLQGPKRPRGHIQIKVTALLHNWDGDGNGEQLVRIYIIINQKEDRL